MNQGDTTHNRLGPSPSIKKMHQSLTYKPTSVEAVFNSGSLFLNNSNFCQVDIKLSITYIKLYILCGINILVYYTYIYIKLIKLIYLYILI